MAIPLLIIMLFPVIPYTTLVLLLSLGLFPLYAWSIQVQCPMKCHLL